MKRILLIEDEADIREITAVSLETVAGWQVMGESNGHSGVATAEREKPDAILLDVMMPGMDGPMTLHALKTSSITRDIPVIFMTAKVQTTDRQRLADLGAEGIISKPFDPITLADQVREVLGWPPGA
jgi:two-component system alkaline phosphatase synthesis response regulator PhoP